MALVSQGGEVAVTLVAGQVANHGGQGAVVVVYSCHVNCVFLVSIRSLVPMKRIFALLLYVPRRLCPLYVASYYMIWVKTSWTYSTRLGTYFAALCNTRWVLGRVADPVF